MKKQRQTGVHDTQEQTQPAIKDIDPIAYEIKGARERRRLTISDLARATGLSRTVLFGYEAGRTRPGARETRLICEALKVSPNRLLFGMEQPFAESQGLAELAKLSARNPMAGVAMSMLLIPIVTAILGVEERAALLTLIGGLVEARDKDAFISLKAAVETMAEFGGDPAKMAELTAAANDPEKLHELQARVRAKVEKAKAEG